MATIFVDNRPYEIADVKGRNLLQACLSLGFDLPYFCYHPAMHAVGACRQCAVKLFRDEKDTQGRIVMSCMTPVVDGMRVSIQDPEAVAFRARVIEWLMVNHPHDCPVCDEGGECHLQDMTVMTGHDYRRFRFRKRTHRNQNLGPLVNHEMNRCIQCYRCVRFYRTFAGGRDFAVLGWHDNVYFGRHAEGTLESEFSGNLVEICPTGVFTDKTFQRHYTRPWDLQTAPSVCVHCGLGCNTIPGERYGELRRVHARYHHEVNGYFLCDRGRFGYEFVNSPRRIRRPMQGKGESRKPVGGSQAMEQAAQWLRDGRAIGVGSARASMETNFALRRLVGEENFYAGVSAAEFLLMREAVDILRGPAPAASLLDVREADAVLVLGEDAHNAAPMLAYSLRQSALRKAVAAGLKRQSPGWHDDVLAEAPPETRIPFYVATPDAVKLDALASETYRGGVDDIAALAAEVAHAIDPSAPRAGRISEEAKAMSGRIAAGLMRGNRPVIVCGTSGGSLAMLRAAANVAWALHREDRGARIHLVVPECNSVGLALLGGKPLSVAVEEIRAGRAETVIFTECDAQRHLSPSDARMLLGVKHVVAMDVLENSMTQAAEIAIPAASYAEADSTYVSGEGRAQRAIRVFVPEGEIRAAWRWVSGIATAANVAGMSWQNEDEILAVMAAEVPAVRGVEELVPPADFRIAGQAVPRQPERYTGRTAMSANVSVHEPQPPADADAPMTFSMEGCPNQPPSSLNPRYWSPGWNSVQAINKFQIEVGGPLSGGDPGRRLLECDRRERPYYDGFAARPAPRELWIAPAYHIFGSDELSAEAPAIAELSPRPYIALSPADAHRLGLCEGGMADVVVGGQTLQLPVRIRPALAVGVAMLPVALPGMPALFLPAEGKISSVAGASQGGRP